VSGSTSTEGAVPVQNMECIGCGRDVLQAVRPYRVKSRRGRALFGGAWLHRCPACELLQVSPVPSAASLSAYYAQSLPNGARVGRDFPRDNALLHHRGLAIAALLEPHLRDRGIGAAPRAIDIGAGYGYLLHAFAERFPGASSTALEILPQCVTHLQSLGVRVHPEPVEAWLEHGDGGYDAILLVHVLEHLRHPTGVLAALRDRLSPRGVLFVEVPHIPPGAHDRCLDHSWVPRFDEPHLSFFSVTTLEACLRRAGFAVVTCAAAGPGYRAIPHWRYRLPRLRPWLVRLVPARARRALRRLHAVTGQDRSGFDPPPGDGPAIWIRAVAAQP
jgi:SAM-dependent methyltransferase